MPTIKTQTEFDIPDEEFERGIVNALRKLPDFVMVVRCKDCKWSRPLIFDGHYCCKRYRVCRKADDFCSRGERREENG